MADEFSLKMPDFHVTFRDLSHAVSTTWDRRFYFPSEGWRAEDFFALKNPMVSVWFESPLPASYAFMECTGKLYVFMQS
jgi:hypothetical protein